MQSQKLISIPASLCKTHIFIQSNGVYISLQILGMSLSKLTDFLHLFHQISKNSFIITVQIFEYLEYWKR